MKRFLLLALLALWPSCVWAGDCGLAIPTVAVQAAPSHVAATFVPLSSGCHSLSTVTAFVAPVVPPRQRVFVQRGGRVLILR